MPLHRVIKLPSALWLSLPLFLSLFLSLSLSLFLLSSPLSLPACLPPALKDRVSVGEVESGHLGFMGRVTQHTHYTHAQMGVDQDGRGSSECEHMHFHVAAAHASPCRCMCVCVCRLCFARLVINSNSKVSSGRVLHQEKLFRCRFAVLSESLSTGAL